MSAPGPVPMTFVMTFGERQGGCERMFFTFLQELDRERIEPRVIFNVDGSFPGEVEALGIPVEVAEHGRFRQVARGAGSVASMARSFRRHPPALVVSWFTKAQLYAGLAAVASGYGRRLAWLQHTLPGATTNLDRPATLMPTRAVVATSNAGAEAQRRIRPHRKVLVVEPGIEPPERLSEEERVRLRESLGLLADRRIVGVVGRLQEWKQQHKAIEAVALLRERGHDVHGLIVGGDSHEVDPGYGPSLHRLARERGVEDAVTFTGHVARASDHMQLMDVVLNTSRHEPFGIVLLEAMALGVPVVAFDSDGGPREILEYGRHGLLARAGDSADLAAQAERLLTDEALREGLVASARDRVEADFTAEAMTRKMEETLLGLA